MQLPELFEKNMKTLLGEEFDIYKNCLDRPMFHGIRINTKKISVKNFESNPFLKTYSMVRK